LSGYIDNKQGGNNRLKNETFLRWFSLGSLILFSAVVVMAVHLRKWGTRANGFARYRVDTQCPVGHQNLFPENQIKKI
jgi:hypothetical protein